jgi:uncharacterized protein (TIGR02284 family)
MTTDTKKHDISTLNELLSLCIDSAKGYREAADLGKDSSLAELFITRADERDEIAEDFQEEVSRLGGTPHEHGTAAGATHRLILNVRTMIGDDRRAAITEVERGEDVIKAAFEKAMTSSDISAPVKSMITEAYRNSIKIGHDQASTLKHAVG